MKKTGIKFGAVLACSVLLTACGSTDKVSNQVFDESVAYSTTFVVDDTELYLGMISEEFLNGFGEDSFSEGERGDFTGVVCDEIIMDLQYVTPQETAFQVCGEYAKLSAYYCLGETDAKLAELIIEWKSGIDEEKLLKSIVDTYGDDYIMDTVFLAGYQEAYRWDEEDGTSIFLVPENEAVTERINYDRFGDGGYFDAGAVLIMAPTAGVKDVMLQETEG